MNYKSFLFLFLLLLLIPVQAICDNSSKDGILIWFYSLEVRENKNYGNMVSFKQTAGATYEPFVINKILPLNPQSTISREDDGNWYLEFAYQKKMRILKDRPLFLGQILDVTTSDTLFEFVHSKYNTPLDNLRYDPELSRYLADRPDLQISHPKIIQVRDKLIRDNPNILDYIIAVDKYVHKQLDYKKPTRPNTAVDLLSMDNGWCGEYNKLKQSLLRSAGIATRDVYASQTGEDGPSVDDTGASKAHVWLQAYIPDVGWISVPSTRKLYKHYQFVRFRGGYYIRAIDLYKHEKEIQQKKYTYNAIDRAGGIRGNGMFFDLPSENLPSIQRVTSKILDYKNNPSMSIIEEIKRLPGVVQPLLYWFLMSVPDRAMNKRASGLFIEALNDNPNLDLQMFYIVSPRLVKQRIDEILETY